MKIIALSQGSTEGRGNEEITDTGQLLENYLSQEYAVNEDCLQLEAKLLVELKRHLLKWEALSASVSDEFIRMEVHTPRDFIVRL